MISLDAKSLKAWWEKCQEYPQAIIAVALVLLVLDVGFVLRGQVAGLGRMWAKARQVKADIVASRSETNNATNYQDQLKSFKVEETELSGKITTQDQIPSVLESIAKFADIAGMRIMRIQPFEDKADAAKSTSGYIRQKISITGKGNFFQLNRFVTLLESASVFMDIQTMELRADDQEYAKQVVTIILEVVMRKV